MKNIIKVLVLVILISGCSDELLETSPKGTLLSSVYFKTEQQVEEALLSTYDVLGHQKGYDLGFAPFLLVSEVLSDDAYAGGQDAGDGAGSDELNRFQVSTASGTAHSLWKKNYYGIARANFTIEKASELENSTEEFVNNVIGQAKFLRAYFYFEQVQFFENIQLVTKVLSPSEAFMPQADPAEVYNQIASDLVDAIAVLPADYGSEQGKATKWAAKALLGRVYLFENGVYGNGLTAGETSVDAAYVLAELEDVIQNSGHDLVSDYASVFTAAEEFGQESVFEISYAGEPVGGDWGSEQYVEGNLAAQMMGPRASGSAIYYRGWSFGIPTHKLYQALDGDPRQSMTIITQEEILAESGAALNTAAYQHTGYYNAKYTTKIVDRGSQGTPELHNMTNFRVIRFSDVLLMAAEIGQNVSYINRVRARVGLTDLGAYSEEALWNERRMELSGEGIRYFDLLRRGQTVAQSELTMTGIIGPNYTGESAVYDVTYNTGTRGFLPIPQTEIDLSNNTLLQNDGY
ncbi:MAG: RagB/SusD family nutrient uptake outer membrane protein [Cyclobacteriaceae bacterium]